jgi:hypothetical protein
MPIYEAVKYFVNQLFETKYELLLLHEGARGGAGG